MLPLDNANVQTNSASLENSVKTNDNVPVLTNDHEIVHNCDIDIVVVDAIDNETCNSVNANVDAAAPAENSVNIEAVAHVENVAGVEAAAPAENIVDVKAAGPAENISNVDDGSENVSGLQENFKSDSGTLPELSTASTSPSAVHDVSDDKNSSQVTQVTQPDKSCEDSNESPQGLSAVNETIFSSDPNSSDPRIFDNHLRIQVGKHNIGALVDTGATVSCISNALLNKLHPKSVQYFKSDITCISGVGGKKHAISDLVQIEFQCSNQTFSHKFYALHNPYMLILGMDFITKHNAKLDFENSTIELGGELFDLTPPPSRSTLVKVIEDTLIQAYCAQDVSVNMSKKPTSHFSLTEPISSLGRKFPDLSVVEGLVSSHNTICRLVNDSDSAIVVPKGTVVAVARSVSVNCVTEVGDFIEPDDDGSEDSVECELEAKVSESHVPPEQAPVMKDRLFSNLARFTKSNLENLGDHYKNTHTVTTGSFSANSQRHYRAAPKMQREIDEQIHKLLKQGLIEPSLSEWRSPVVMVRKRDSSYRFACDYRLLNARTEKQSYPMPRLEDVWDLIGEAKPQYFSVLDLASGFWQIRMDPETKHKASFVTRSGQYTWNRMPFGLRNAPITFQKTMNEVLGDLINKTCIVYIDDIIVWSKDFDSHMLHLQQIFDRLEQANLTLKASKCQFAVERVKYLGHILSRTGVEPDPDKIAIVETYPAPKNPKQVRQFLGLTNYYRRFVKNYGDITKPLHNLTKKNEPFVWSDKCKESFETLKRALTSSPCLAYPDMEKPFILTTDASTVALSYILSQKQDNVEHVIAYAGRALRGAELNYGITELEALAVVEGFRHFHTYLYGTNTTTVITDHAALVYIKNNTKIQGRVARWAILMQNYEYNVVHRKGKDNTNADALSRIDYPPDKQDNDTTDPDLAPRHADVFATEAETRQPWTQYEFVYDSDDDVDECDDKCNELSGRLGPHCVLPINDVDIVTLQQDCPEIGPFYKYHKSGILPDDVAMARRIAFTSDQYGLANNVLYHFYQPRTRNAYKATKSVAQIVIPKQLRYNILSDYHDSIVGGGHSGFDRTREAILQKYYWPGMTSDILDYQQSCLKCQRAKDIRQKRPPLQPLPVVGLHKRWHMDFIGPIRNGYDGSKYILLLVDSFSRWPEAFCLPSADAVTVAKVLFKEIFTRYGAPAVLVSDRGPQFMSSLVNNLSQLFHVKRSMTSPYHPQTNAACERFNSFLLAALRTYVRDDQADWPDMVPGILMAYRHTPAHRSTEFSPYFLCFNQTMRLPIDTAINPDIMDVSLPFREDMSKFLKFVQLGRSVAEENILRHQQQNKQIYDRNSADPTFEIGDLVWRHDPRVPVGYSKKLRAQWVGPYRVCELGPNFTYRLRHAETNQVLDSYINATRLKLASTAEESAIRVMHQRYLERMNLQNRQVQGRQDPANTGQTAINGEAPTRDGQPDNDDVDDDDDEDSQVNGEVTKVVKITRNNKGKWFHVKFKDIPGLHWRLEGFVEIPDHLLQECLRRYTWSGKPRKRKRKKL